ncbi:MAG: hypothetical protein OXG40_11930, partial [Acidimicrobiaceae bacterium]|nr:hypothetical protein [Acidimicrobiaceae bacterium]
GTYTVRLDSEPTGNVVIDLAIPDGAPFTATPTSLTFTPSGTGIWSTGQAVTITAANDDLDNAGDRRQAVITHDLKAGSSDYGGVTVENVTVAVTDDDGAVSFAIADASATEGGAVTFTVSRAGATGGTATVSWNTSSDGDGDHPASTSDYTPQTTAQSLSFASGETSRTFTVQTTQDQIDEENETFLVILSAPGAGTSISDGTAIGTITDDDGAPTGIALTVDADTGTDGVQTGLAEDGGARTVRLTATVQGGTTFTDDRTVTVEVGKAADTATEGTDYTTVAAQTITIPAGTASAHVDFTLTPTDDGLDEATETVTLTGTAAGTTVDGTSITINDDDTRGVTVVPTSLTLRETDDPATTEAEENSGTYTVRLDSEPTGNVVIDLAPPEGIIVTPSSLTFTLDGIKAWSSPQMVTVTVDSENIDNTGDVYKIIIDHTIAEESSDYKEVPVDDVELDINDDNMPMVSFVLDSSQADESAGMHHVMVTVDPVSDADFMVEFDLDGTATPEMDHMVKPEVMIPAGEPSVRIPVEIVEDDIPEEEETVTMKVMESPDYQMGPIDRHIINIIDNDSQSAKSNPVAAWQTRFGRTVAEHALEGVSNRIEAPRHGQTEIQLAGYQLDLNPAGSTSDPESIPALSGNGNTGHHAGGTPGSEGDPGEQNTMTLHEALLNSSFTTMGRDGSTLEGHAFWGRISQSSFEGREGDLSFGGEVTTAMLGADRTRGKWLVGLAVLQSTGEGTYSFGGEPGKAVEASLTAMVPYASLTTSERFRMWGALGYGNGWIAHGSDPDRVHRADLSWSLAAIGVRSDVLAAVEAGDLEVAVVADAFWTATKSEGRYGLSGETTRLRVGLEGTREMALGDNGYLTPVLGISLRHDGGDAETGWGVEVSAGINWHDASSGLTVDLSGWKLIAHTSDGFSDWGYSLSVLYDPNPHSNRGLSASYSQSVNGSENDILNALPQPGQFNGEGAISRQAEVSYGFPAFDGQYTGSPYMAASESGYTRDLTLGGRLTREHGSPDLELGVMGRRSEGNGPVPDYSVGVDVTTRW